MQPELLLFAHHPSYSSGLVCLFVSFLVFCLFVLFVHPPSSCFAQHIDHKEESPLTDDREYAQGVASEGLLLSAVKVQKEDMFCATQHGEEKQQINPSSANRFALVKHEKTLNTAQEFTFGAKLCGFVCKDRAQHSIEHHYKADIASCIGSIIIMR